MKMESRGKLDRILALIEAKYPDPYVFALALTLLAFGMTWFATPYGLGDIAQFWGKGFVDILAFATQMALILITGYALALSRPVERLLDVVASWADTLPQAVILVGLFSGVASWIQWGLGLVVAALLALRFHRQKGYPLPILVASGYTGFLVWHSGLSGSIPLTIATPGLAQNYLEQVSGHSVTVLESVGAWWNLLPAMIVLVAATGVLAWVASRESMGILEREVPIPSPAVPADGESGGVVETLLHLGVAGIGGLAVGVSILHQGLTLNVVIWIFLVIGMVLHRSPMRYSHAVSQAVPAVAGILLQFPFYGGIQGMLIHSGLGERLALWMAQHTPREGFYLVQFLLAGLINLFVPSGGGQWVVQGPVAMKASQVLHVDPVISAMAIAWGDAWTNMIQPFWALPLLGVAKLPARCMIRYTVRSLAVSGVVWAVWCVYLGIRG